MDDLDAGISFVGFVVCSSIRGRDTGLYGAVLHISCWFFPAVGLLCILRYAIQGVGFSNLAMLSGVSEMIARILVSLYAVPAFGFLGVCFGDPLAWVAADLFLIPAFLYVYKKIKKRLDDEKVSVSAV